MFQSWVNSEILPSIRKHGAYVKDQEKVATGKYVRTILGLPWTATGADTASRY